MPVADPSAGVIAALRESRPELAGVLPNGDQPWPIREWLLRSWAAALDSDENHRHLLFHAGPGFGKTVVSAQYALRVAADGGTVAAIFFRSGYAALEDPLGVVERLSRQLAGLLPGFREEREVARQESGAGNPLRVSIGDVTVRASQIPAGGTVIGAQVAAPSGRPVERAWRCDIADPLRALDQKAALPIVVIITDGLDETSTPVLRMLADGLTLLPERVRVLMTARPGTEPPIGDPAVGANVRRITPDNAWAVGAEWMDTRGDDEELIAQWARQRLMASREDDAWASQLARRIADEADRNFLVAFHITEDIAQRFPAETAAPPAGEVALPTGGLPGVYDAFLSRLFDGPDSPLWRTRGRPVLGLLSVARDAGLTLGMLSGASGLDGTDLADALKDCAAFVRPDSIEGNKVWRIWHRTFAEHIHESDAFAVRSHDWHRRLGASLEPVALEQGAATVGRADYRRQYAVKHAAVHLLDAAADPEGIATEEAAASLQRFVDAGRWVEALVALAGPIASAAVVERLAPYGPSVPLRALAEALRTDAHVLTAEVARSDGFTIGQLSMRAALTHDQLLTATLEEWSSEGRRLFAAWTTEAAPPGRVITTHRLGITAMAVANLDAHSTYLTAGLDGRVRAWSDVTGQIVATWEDSARRPIGALASCPRGSESIVAVGTQDGTRVLRWPPSGVPVELWTATDGPVHAALALHLRTDSVIGGAAPEWILVTTHSDGVLKARDLMTGEMAGDPPMAPMPVWALEAVDIPSTVGAGTRTALVAASTSEDGQAFVWDPLANQTMKELFLGGAVTCLAGPGGNGSGLLAAGYSDGDIRLWNLSAHEDGIDFTQGASRSVGRTRKASPETVSALAWIQEEGRLTLLAGDSAGRIHRLDPATLSRSASWIAGHASTVSSLVAIVQTGLEGFVSAGFDGLVKSWLPHEISGDAWPEQVLNLDVVMPPDRPPAVACGHANGEISLRSAHNGELLARRQVHDAPIWAVAWAGPRFGIVSGDATGRLVGSQVSAALGAPSAWQTRELAQLSGQVSSVAPGVRDGEPVVGASTLFSEIVVIDEHADHSLLPPFGGVPLGLRLVTIGQETAIVVEREVTREQSVMTGEPQGRQLQVTVRIPKTDEWNQPDWRLWWDHPEMLGSWETVSSATDTDGAPPLIIVGLRDGAVLSFDLKKIVADPNLTREAYQSHEVWPHRAGIVSLAAALVHGTPLTAWTTEDGWLFVHHSWEEPPLRVHLGSRILASKVSEDGTIFLGGTNGVTAVRVL